MRSLFAVIFNAIRRKSVNLSSKSAEMFSKSNVELTRVHYFDESNLKNVEIPTISREIYRNGYKSNVVIKRNVFGHTWVLKINENQEKKRKCPSKLIVYLWVFSCVIIAVTFGIYFSLDRGVKKVQISRENSTVRTTTEKPVSHRAITNEAERLTKICEECGDKGEICLKTTERHLPVCAKAADARDPSGCGGLCELNVRRCKKLHKDIEVFQCVDNEVKLRCGENEFDCGKSCIFRAKKCDGVIDCPSMADENDCECNLDYYFHCGNGTSCIENTRRCDGSVDCWDGSDESDCERDCETDKYPCVNRECIEKEQYCDGIVHCADGSDEPSGCEK